MEGIKLSFCMSAIRPHLWEELLNSLKSNSLKYEVIFVGNVRPEFDILKYPEMKYIYATVKPSQCYQIAFNNASGQLITWGADDAIYSSHAVDEIYSFWTSLNNPKAVIGFRTIEDGRDITEVHRFIGRNMESPRMAPFGVMSTQLLRDIGGYDRRFVCGQSENDVVMRVLEVGGNVYIHPTASAIVSHEKAHYGGTVFRTNFYHDDRRVLENAWMNEDRTSILKNRKYPVEPFELKDDITSVTQSNRGNW